MKERGRCVWVGGGSIDNADEATCLIHLAKLVILLMLFCT